MLRSDPPKRRLSCRVELIKESSILDFPLLIEVVIFLSYNIEMLSRFELGITYMPISCRGRPLFWVLSAILSAWGLWAHSVTVLNPA